MVEQRDSRWHTDLYKVSEMNWLPEVRKDLEARDSVRIYDCTLREIEQSPHVVLKPDEKFALGKALDKLGVYSMQIFPKTSQEDAEVMEALSKSNLNARLTALCRWRADDIDLAKKCGANEVRVEGPGNPWIARNYLDLDEDQLIDKMIETGKYAQSAALPGEDVPAAGGNPSHPHSGAGQLRLPAALDGNVVLQEDPRVDGGQDRRGHPRP